MRSITVLLIPLLFFACNNKEKESDDIFYPHTEHKIEFIGSQKGLTITSSEKEFNDALNEITDQFEPDPTNSIHAGTPFTFDGITYEITNLQTGVPFPQKVWDTFWKDLKEFHYSIGSCWAFHYIDIPSKGETGTVYLIYAIVRGTEFVNSYSGQATLSPTKTRSSLNTQNPIHTIIDGNHPCYIAKKQKI